MAKRVQFSFRRYEKKYFLTSSQQKDLLNIMKPYLKADDYGKYTICNIYYDTDDWRLIRESIEKPVYKEKLRVRSYGIPAADSPVFVEIKKKYDGIVYKRRIAMEAGMTEFFLENPKKNNNFGQIGNEIAWFQKFYNTRPKVFIAYDRMAFTGVEDPGLRITFDTHMRWRDTELNLCLGDHGKPIISDEPVLMEIKMPGVCPLWLSHMLSEAGIFPASFSKYGTCYRNHIIKVKKEDYFCA